MTGEVANRILLEVLRGVILSPDDNEDEREYRAQIKVEVDQIHAEGGMVEPPKEWP